MLELPKLCQFVTFPNISNSVHCVWKWDETLSYLIHGVLHVHVRNFISGLLACKTSYPLRCLQSFLVHYSQTCIKRPCINRSPSIKRSVVKVPKIYPLNYSKCDLY